MKIIINESQYNFLVEQTTPPVTSGITPVTSASTSTTTTVLTRQQKRVELEKKVKERNAARLAPIEAKQKERINNWIASNPGKTKEDYWKMEEKRNKGSDADIYDGQKCGLGNDKPGCSGSKAANERRLKRERNR